MQVSLEIINKISIRDRVKIKLIITTLDEAIEYNHYRLISIIFHCENVQIGNHQQDNHTRQCQDKIYHYNFR